MTDSDHFEEPTNLVPQPKMQPTGTPTWLWGVLALLAAAVIAGAGFIGATIEGSAKDKTISAVENNLAQEQRTATQARSLADALQAELENEQQLAVNNEATADARSTLIVDSNATADTRSTQIVESNATADAEVEARATQEEIAAEELAARETAEAGSTSIANTAQADSDARATAEAQATDSDAARATADAQASESAATAEAEIQARATADAQASESAATAEAEAQARGTQERLADEAQAAVDLSETQIANADATESALRSDLANIQVTSEAGATQVADASNALATQESRAIANAGTASAAQIEVNRLQSTIDAAIVSPPSVEAPDTLGPPNTDVTTQLVRSSDDLYSIRLPRNWVYEEDLSTDSLSDFYFGQTTGEMTSMRSDDTASGIGGALFFFAGDGNMPSAESVEASLEFSVNFYIDIGAIVLNEPFVYSLADGRPIATQTIAYNAQDLYIYVVGMNRMTVIGLVTEPSDSEGTWHAQLEQIMVSINSPPINGISSGVDSSFDLNAEQRNLSQTFTTSDGRLTLHLPSGWEFEDTFSTENNAGFSGGLNIGSVFAIEDEAGTFSENSAVTSMSLMTFGVNRIVVEQGGHLLAEPSPFERGDGVIAVFCLVQDELGLIRWTAVFVVDDQTIAVAEVNHIGASSFPQERDQLLAIVLSIEYNGQGRSSGPSG